MAIKRPHTATVTIDVGDCISFEVTACPRIAQRSQVIMSRDILIDLVITLPLFEYFCNKFIKNIDIILFKIDMYYFLGN